MKTHFTYHYDGGHGWFRVPMRMLEKLFLLDKISSFSYQSKDGKTAFLEEDSDASIFFSKMKEYGYDENDLKLKAKNDGDRSPIRNLPSFNGGK